jgi:hypothetical protein
MTKCPFILGTINKKLFLSLFLAILQVAMILIYRFYPKKENNLVVQLFVLSIGEMLIKTFPYILKFSDIGKLNEKEKEKEQKTQNNARKHYIYLGLLYSLNVGLLVTVEVLNSVLRGQITTYSGSNLVPNHDFIILSLEMIFIVLVSMCLLKYRYYKHHIISMILFLIFGIISEIILKTYNDINWKYILIICMRIIGVLVNATYYCYQKYMMENLFLPYWNVAFVPGVVMLLLAFVFLGFCLASKDSKLSFIVIFYSFFKTDPGLGAGKIIIVFVLHTLMSPLAILILYHFGPNFVLTIFQFSRVVQNLTTIKVNQLYVIIFFILQFISLLIHLEIIELNFCGLNKYTKRNIEIRGIDDLELERSDTLVNLKVGIDKDYDIELKDDEKAIEMRDKEGENENVE